MLDGTDVLAPGDVETITFTVRVDPNGEASFENVADGSADRPGGVTVTDTSTDGAILMQMLAMIRPMEQLIMMVHLTKIHQHPLISLKTLSLVRLKI